MHTSKVKKGVHSLLPISRQVLSRLQGGRAPLRVTVTWEDKHPNSKYPSFLLPPAFIADHNSIRYGLSLWSAGVSCPSCAPSQLLLHPQPTC